MGRPYRWGSDREVAAARQGTALLRAVHAAACAVLDAWVAGLAASRWRSCPAWLEPSARGKSRSWPSTRPAAAPTRHPGRNVLTGKVKPLGTASATSPTTTKAAAAALRRQVTHSPHRKTGRALPTLDGEEPLKQTTAQASSTNANHRPESRSHRTCSRLQQLNHDSDRSTRQRCRPNLVDDSTPRRAIRGRIP